MTSIILAVAIFTTNYSPRLHFIWRCSDVVVLYCAIDTGGPGLNIEIVDSILKPCKARVGALVLWLWDEIHILKVVGFNPSIVYRMDIFTLSVVIIIMFVCIKNENRRKEAGYGHLKNTSRIHLLVVFHTQLNTLCQYYQLSEYCCSILYPGSNYIRL